ncbi:hypothetical protein MOC17_16210 [Bacillus haynesii]|uniref:hypothetical protein n=1 Tax=Bacillus haynesii TaxID=1925021 RepID=UPI00227F5C2D|nr:hypothetical protein [Bacillus haynesii]MCY8047613.1 hypothetical protein [Bacillus haynesii]
MARLHGVKTLDMVNGEITKVAHERTEYERVEGVVQTGDLVLIRTDVRDTTQGAYYYVRSTKGRYAVIRDDVGDSHDLSRGCYDLFREVSASQPSLEDRVSTNEKDIESLKSDVAALKGEAKTEYVRIAIGEAKAGDFVKFIETNDGALTIGKMYEIEDFHCDADPSITDDKGDYNCASKYEVFEVYRKVSAASVEAEPKPERLKVGDYAKVVGGARDHQAEINDIVQVTFDDDGTLPFRCDDINGKSIGWFYEAELVRATDEEVAEAKRKQTEEEERKRWAAIGREVGEYKVGDVVAYDDPVWFENSGIGEIIGFGDGGNPEVKAIDYEGCRASYFLKPECLNLVTPVEARFDRKDDE